MAKVFLATPKKEQDPQVTAWADDVIKVQEKEIAEMKELLKPLGGIEESAYAPMKKAMQHMLEEGKNLGANMRFVELMLPHHAMALEMSVPALLGLSLIHISRSRTGSTRESLQAMTRA